MYGITSKGEMGQSVSGGLIFVGTVVQQVRAFARPAFVWHNHVSALSVPASLSVIGMMSQNTPLFGHDPYEGEQQKISLKVFYLFVSQSGHKWMLNEYQIVL